MRYLEPSTPTNSSSGTYSVSIVLSAATAIFDRIRLESVRIGWNWLKVQVFWRIWQILTLFNRVPSNMTVAADRTIEIE